MTTGWVQGGDQGKTCRGTCCRAAQLKMTHMKGTVVLGQAVPRHTSSSSMTAEQVQQFLMQTGAS